jgi:hypothetical protein
MNSQNDRLQTTDGDCLLRFIQHASYGNASSRRKLITCRADSKKKDDRSDDEVSRRTTDM